ncbi:hypothetical protein F4805DRAFT_462682 [Annulohypoxylon moriforme]|nr:hypothetical protein F4805DRAFT_462682 [Annulohypoxylon moriforme]
MSGHPRAGEKDEDGQSILLPQDVTMLLSMKNPPPSLPQSALNDRITELCCEIDPETLSPLEKLPPELKALILSYCDPKSVLNIACTGPLLHRYVMLNEARISRSVICRHISPDLRCLAAARYWTAYHGFPVARGLSGEWRTPCAQGLTWNFLDWGLEDDRVFMGSNPDGFYKLFHYTLGIAHKIVSFDETVKFFASTLSGIAIKRGPRSIKPFDNGDLAVPEYVTQVSPGEFHRFVKALYIFDVATAILPFVESSDVNSEEYAMWHDFWEQFSPWEQQQVRCVHQMLQGWVKTISLLQGSVVAIDFGDDLLAQYVIFNGLAELLRLKTGFYRSVEHEIIKFRNSLEEHALPPRTEIWMQGMDEYWLSRDDLWDEVSLDVTGLLGMYEEDDTGPRDAWIHTLLENRKYHVIFREGYNRQFSCETCMTKWGFIFWDRAKLEWHSSGTMPTAKQMVEVTGDTKVSTEFFRRQEWGRQRGICQPFCAWKQGPFGQLIRFLGD